VSLQLLFEFLHFGTKLKDGVGEDFDFLLVVVLSIVAAPSDGGYAGICFGVWRDAVFGKHFRRNAPALGENAELLGDVAELTYVARPFVGVDDGLCLGREADGFRDVVTSGCVERELLEDYDIQNVLNAFSFTYSANGHDFYVLTVPDEKTWVFDMTTGVWHERKTTGLKTWIVSSVANAFNKNIVGDLVTGNLYELDCNYFSDNTAMIEREMIFPPVFAEDNRLVMDKMYLDISTAPTENLTQNPQIMLMWSDNGGNTWSSEHWRSFGMTGNYKTRVIWRALGQCRQRIYKIRITDGVKVQISGLYCEGEQRYA
jgi:hypothetical protein